MATTIPPKELTKKDKTAIAGIIVYIVILVVVFASTLSAYWLLAIAKTPDEGAKLCMVIASGLLGSLLFMCGSLAFHAGTKGFKASWTIWYLLQPVTGIGLALLAFYAINAGLIASGMNIYGIMLVCTLFGMFSNEANTYLHNLFKKLTSSEEKSDKEKNKDKAEAATTDYTKLDLTDQADIAAKAADDIKTSYGITGDLSDAKADDGTGENTGVKVIALTATDGSDKATLLNNIGNPYTFNKYKIPVEVR